MVDILDHALFEFERSWSLTRYSACLPHNSIYKNLDFQLIYSVWSLAASLLKLAS